MTPYLMPSSHLPVTLPALKRLYGPPCLFFPPCNNSQSPFFAIDAVRGWTQGWISLGLFCYRPSIVACPLSPILCAAICIFKCLWSHTLLPPHTLSLPLYTEALYGPVCCLPLQPPSSILGSHSFPCLEFGVPPPMFLSTHASSCHCPPCCTKRWGS